jgi:hypothetical protein
MFTIESILFDERYAKYWYSVFRDDEQCDFCGCWNCYQEQCLVPDPYDFDKLAKHMQPHEERLPRPHGKPRCAVKGLSRQERVAATHRLSLAQDNPRANTSKERLLKLQFGCTPKKVAVERRKTRLTRGKKAFDCTDFQV